MPGDPILSAALAELATKQKALAAQGVQVTPAHIEEFMRARTGGKYGADAVTPAAPAPITAGDLTRSAVNGASLGWADEFLNGLTTEGGRAGARASGPGGAVLAAIGPLVEKLMGTAAGDAMKRKEQAFHAAHPVADFAAQAAGGLVPALLAPEAKAASVGGAMLNGALSGAAAGAVAGAGNAEDGSRGSAAVAGGVGGGLLGGAIPGVVGAVKSLRDPGQRAAGRVAAAIEASGGKPALSAKLADAVAAGKGDHVMLGDLSDPLRMEADFAANNSDRALVPLAQKVRERQAGMSDRLLQDMKAGVGGNPIADARIEQLAGETRQWAASDQGYEGLRAASPTVDMASVAARLKKPTIASAWRQAQLAGDITQESPINQAMQRLMAANPGADEATLRKAAESVGMDVGPSSAQRPISFDDVQQMKRALDGKVDAAVRSGNGALAKAYGTVRDEISGALEEAAPGFKAVNQQYAARKSLEQAVTDGVSAWKGEDSRGLAEQVGRLTPEQLAQFRAGMASEALANLRSVKTNKDAAAQFTNMSPALRDKLATVFGDQATFDRFLKSSQWEEEMARMKGPISGSATARRLQAQGFNPAELGITALTGGPVGVGHAILHGIAKSTTGAMNRATAEGVGQKVMTQGAPNIEALLAQLGNPTPLVGPWTRGKLPVLSGGLLGSLAGR